EFVISFEQLKKETTVSALDLAKRLLDYGFHAPTVYFPQIVKEAWMIEPTENASKRELDEFCEVVKRIIDEAYNSPDLVKNAPYNTAVKRIDEAYGSRPNTMAPTYRWVIKRNQISP
ncbi:MAG: aminomethyl-transferring glycine dehydrogenase subunit GcvPB, partial [Candidatus Geothermarchaeota archaeon]